jgi:prolyl oligopeptidase
MKTTPFILNTGLTISFILVFTSLLYFSCSDQNSIGKPPVAKAEDVPDTLHGTIVHDPYRWLEDWNDPAVQAWSEGQNRYARRFLDQLPDVKQIRSRVSEIYEDASVNYSDMIWRENKLFAIKNQPPLNQALLVYMPSAEEPDQEKIIVDPNKLDPTSSTSIDWYVPSPDGELAAVCMSEGGSERGNLHIFETKTGHQVGEVIQRVNQGTAGGDLAWKPDGSGYYYTRYPRPGERPDKDLAFYQQVYYHQMGTLQEDDHYIIGKDFPKIGEIRLKMDDQTGRLLLTLQMGDGRDFSFYLMNAYGRWREIIPFGNQIVEGTFGPDRMLYFISLNDAPLGKIIRMSPLNPSLVRANVIIPEGKDAIVSSFYSKSKFVVSKTRIYITYQMGGPSDLRVFDLKGNQLAGPQILPVSSVNELTPVSDDNILFSNSSYIVPKAWFLFDAANSTTTRTKLFNTSPVNFSNSEVRREFATSKDGTRIPVNIIMKKNTKLDGNNPTILYGYGGYGFSETPNYNPLRYVWIEQGGIYAVANIRGGGEYGEAWHQAGMLTKKQNVFDDFTAAMEYLIKKGYTGPEKLAIMGGSNGGLLMGAMITQHPDLFKATVSSVGVYDMIRVEQTPNGRFNIPEYGTVQNPEQFKALYTYSPYHNVHYGVKYPAVLFMTGANDPRVDPMHSRKMIAQLQAASSSDNPILLRTSSGTGHGYGTPTNEKINESVAKYTFLFYELGINYKPIK